jgi:ferric-dicitrate binding protein FerR (iron transport regulator)
LPAEEYELIVRCLSGEASPSEWDGLQAWLAQSPENKKLFERSQYLWRHSSAVQPHHVPDAEAEWARLENIIKSRGPRTATILPLAGGRLPSRRPTIFVYAAVAAAIAMFVLTRLFFSAPDLQVVSTGNGQMIKVNLPDGSTVTLNHDSRMEFDEDLPNSGRKIRLDGEAFFEVAEDSSVFSVHTGNAIVQVLGTKFNVWGRNRETRVFVSEGKVSLQNEGKEAILHRNQYSRSRGSEPPVKPEVVDAENRLAWMQGKLIFDKTPLRELVAELTRKYDVDVRLSSSGLDTLTVTGSFQQQPLETVLRSLCMTLNLRYEARGNAYIIAAIAE